jgi:hypothetical protein
VERQTRYDYPLIAAELIRALRAERSQTALSRRLGYKSNVIYIWEAQKGAPTAAGFFTLVRKVGGDPLQALRNFYRAEPAWLCQEDLGSREGPAAFLEDLKGGRTLVQTARNLSASRYALARWLSGEAEPRLPDFLETIEVTSLRLLDFVAAFVDPSQLPSLSQPWSRLQKARQAAYSMPWSHGILRALELKQYQALSEHEPGWIARRLGIDPSIEEEALQVLEATGQIALQGNKWSLLESGTIDTRADPAAAKQLKAWWFEVGKTRFLGDAEGVFSYNLFGVSNKDLRRLQDLQRAYFRELRNIVAQSEPVETVALFNVQLFELGENASQSSS